MTLAFSWFEKNYSPNRPFLFILFILFQSINLGRKYIPYIQLRFIFILFIAVSLGIFVAVYLKAVKCWQAVTPGG